MGGRESAGGRLFWLRWIVAVLIAVDLVVGLATVDLWGGSAVAEPPPPVAAPVAVRARPVASVAVPAAARALDRRERIAPSPPKGPRPFTVDSYGGLAAWLDVYDWSLTYARGGTPAELPDIDRMAALGAQVLWIQATKADSPDDVLEAARLKALITRAHQRGLRVVAWYLPTLEDTAFDLRRLTTIAGLPVDGIGVDLESRAVADPADRSARAAALSQALRAALPGRALAAIPLPPVQLDVINSRYWPGYPWAALAADYDVWAPMGYWTLRTPASGYRDAYTYTAQNIDMVRRHLGAPTAPCVALGGIADTTSPADVAGMITAANERGCIGGGLYDYRTTGDALWAPLAALRR